jgi:chromosome segregation ATPase
VDRFYAKVQAAIEDASFPEPDPPRHQVFRDPNDEIKAAVEKRDAQLQPQIATLAAQARAADLLRNQNRSLRRTLAAKDKQIARLDDEIKGLRRWIQRAREALIEGGTKLAASGTWSSEAMKRGKKSSGRSAKIGENKESSDRRGEKQPGPASIQLYVNRTAV